MSRWIVMALMGLAGLSANAADEERGKSLHDTHCRMCHDATPYQRETRVAKTYEQLRAQVSLWQGNTGLKWSAADIDAVTAYLASAYYHIPCPSAC